MADNNKYYYMRLVDSFFNSGCIAYLESIPNGYEYCVILLKLYLLSLRTGGRLIVSNEIKYTPQMIARSIGHAYDIVEKALEEFKKLELIELLDNDVIYMPGLQNYVGRSTSEADRKRSKRQQSTNKETSASLMPKEPLDICQDKCPPELELESELEKKERIKNTTKEEPFFVFASGDEKLLAALRDFEQSRQETKNPMTDIAKRRLCSKLETLAEESGVRNRSGYMQAVLGQSIVNGWKGVFKDDSFVDMAAPIPPPAWEPEGPVHLTEDSDLSDFL